MSEPIHAALVRIALPPLAYTLRMPKGTEIHGAFIDPHRPDVIYLRVTHASLPEYRVGDVLHEVELVIYERTCLQDNCPLKPAAAIRESKFR